MDILSYIFGSSGVPFTPETDIPPLTNKVILITGANSGLGKQSALELAKHSPALIWLAARNLEKAHDAAVDIRAEVADAHIKTLELDLASFASVQSAAKRVLTESGPNGRLDILMLNAGIMMTPAGVTQDGYELQFGTNHLGHALLTKLLAPLLVQTAKTHADADVRLVVLTSDAHQFAPSSEGILFDSLKSDQASLYSVARYGQSKLANILFAREVGRRYKEKGIKCVSVHPGRVNTNLTNPVKNWNFLTRMLVPLVANYSGFITTVDNGARNQLWAAAGAKREELVDGEYYIPVGKLGPGSKFNKDDELARRLWEWTEQELEGWSI
ncbi:hypothetical protein V8F20_007085 [Naviculisporaceae sp. PSN 640]